MKFKLIISIIAMFLILSASANAEGQSLKDKINALYQGVSGGQFIEHVRGLNANLTGDAVQGTGIGNLSDSVVCSGNADSGILYPFEAIKDVQGNRLQRGFIYGVVSCNVAAGDHVLLAFYKNNGADNFLWWVGYTDDPSLGSFGADWQDPGGVTRLDHHTSAPVIMANFNKTRFAYQSRGLSAIEEWLYQDGGNATIVFDSGGVQGSWNWLNDSSSLSSMSTYNNLTGCRNKRLNLEDRLAKCNISMMIIGNETLIIEEFAWMNNRNATIILGKNVSGGGGGGDATPPTFSNNGTNNTAPRINDIVKFNITLTDASNISGFIFSWDNGTGSFINNSFVFADAGMSVINVSVNKTISNVSGTVIQYQWYANDTAGNKGSTSVLTLTVAGTSPPNLTLNSNNFFSANNNTFFRKNDSERVLLNFTLSDDIDVFGFEFNVTNASWQVIINFTNNSMSGFVGNFSQIINVSAPQGWYNVSITVWDTHTAQYINNYKVNDGIGNDILFNDKIRITGDSAISTKAIKKFDRYELEFDYLPFLAPKTKIYYIESDGDLTYRKDSIYKGHFVDWKNKIWIDFEGIEEKQAITKISEKKYKIEFANKDSKIIFHSIGGLNSKVYNFQYYISDPSVQWVSRSSTFSLNQNVSVVLNVTGDFLNQTSFYLWNSSFNLVSITNVTASANGTYFYNTTLLTLTDTIYYVNATHFARAGNSKDSPTIILSQQQLNNCTPAGINTANYTFKDEGNNSIINIGTVTGTYNYNVSSVYTRTYTNINNYTICVYPNGTSISSTYSIVYSGNGYPQRTYSGTTIFNNVTQSVNLYGVASANGIFAIFRITDQFSSPIQGATGTAQTLISGTLTTVEIETSDSSGLMTFFINPDIQYTFIFAKSGYSSLTVTLRVTTSDIYTVTLSTAAASISESYAAGITYILSPQSQTLQNDTDYNFTFNLTSQYWNLTNCILYLENTTQQFASSSLNFNGSRCNINITFNTGNNSFIIARAVYQLNGTFNQSVMNQYSVKYIYKGTFSLKNAIDDISNFGGAGFDNFGRALLALVLTFIILGALSLNYSAIREPEALLLIAWAFTALFSYVGWYKVPFSQIPPVAIAGITQVSQLWLQQYIIFILMTLFVSTFLINKFVA